MVHKIGRLLRSPVKFHQPKYVQNHKNRFGSGSNCLSQITGWKTQSRGEKTREFISNAVSSRFSREFALHFDCADCVFSRGYSLRKPSENLADGQVILSYKPGAKRSQPNDPDCENAVSEGISLVEGIELTANAGEVGQSEVQLEQFS